MASWKRYVAVAVPLAGLIWAQLSFSSRRRQLRLGVEQQLDALQEKLATTGSAAGRSEEVARALGEIEWQVEAFSSDLFYTLLFFGLFPLAFAISLLATQRVKAPVAPREAAADPPFDREDGGERV